MIRLWHKDWQERSQITSETLISIAKLNSLIADLAIQERQEKRWRERTRDVSYTTQKTGGVRSNLKVLPGKKQ